jgi:hypothetical protein
MNGATGELAQVDEDILVGYEFSYEAIEAAAG